MPHPADDPAAALAITRGLPGQLQKAKAAGDLATVAALEAVLVRARKILRATRRRPRRALRFRHRRRRKAGPRSWPTTGSGGGGDTAGRGGKSLVGNTRPKL